MPRRKAPDVTAQDVYRFSREEFLNDYWDYGSSGDAEHNTFIGQTRSGKTTWAFQLLEASTQQNPEMGRDDGDILAVVIVMKPRDRTPESWGNRLGYKRIDTWPPPMMRTKRKYNIQKQPPGYLLWPKLGNLKTDNDRIRVAADALLQESYSQAAKKGHQERIIFADEVIGLQRLSNRQHNLVSHLNDLYERGAGMGIGLWAALQRPFNAPPNAYENSSHLFLWRANDKRNRQRYTEIGTIDADVIDGVVSTLRGRDCLYINRTVTEDEPEFYVIGAD